MQHGIKRLNITEEVKRAKIEKDKIKIQRYRDLTSEIFKLRDNETYSIESLNTTTDLLLINPEFYTIWNYRREILLELFERKLVDQKQSLEDDLKLVMSQLKRFPKCYWIWNHRMWCLLKLQGISQANWEFELAIVSKLLELDSRNYHGWQYRRYVVENIEKCSGQTGSEQDVISLLEINIKEFQYTTTKVNNNISNFSAWHNRSKLIPKIYHLLCEVEDKSQFKEISEIFRSPYDILVHELELVKTGMYMDVDDTSIWSYLYWLLTDKLFVNDLKLNNNNERLSYVEILKDQLKIVEELNELEKSDHIYHWDNCLCLKSIILLRGLIKREEMGEVPNDTLLTDEIKKYLNRLIEIDPLRKGKYLDQLHGKSSIISIAY